MNDEFAYLILSIVSEIPYGKVASYSQIAKLSGYPNNARQVGKVLSNSVYFGYYPCHRVIHNDGTLVACYKEQKELLIDEGIKIVDNKIDMKIYRW